MSLCVIPVVKFLQHRPRLALVKVLLLLHLFFDLSLESCCESVLLLLTQGLGWTESVLEDCYCQQCSRKAGHDDQLNCPSAQWSSRAASNLGGYHVCGLQRDYHTRNIRRFVQRNSCTVMVTLHIRGLEWDAIEDPHSFDIVLEVGVWVVALSCPVYRENLR